LGGLGQTTEESRDLSEIEIALIDQVASLVIGEWCNHWPEMRGLQPSLLGHENNSRYLQTASPDAAMLVLTMNGGIGEQSEAMQIVFPYATVEPLVRLLSPAMPGAESLPTRAAKPKWNAQFDEVKVPVVAEWHGLKMSAGEISRLKVGDMLALDPACAAQVHLLLSHVPKFIGRPGTTGGKWAVQLTNINNNNAT
jgi:flagellar motor switch protein FliM